MTWTLLSAALVAGCGGSPTSSTSERQQGDPITVSGTLGEGLSVMQSVARGFTASRSIAGAVSGIASIPVIAGSASVGPETEILPILADGTFSATLQPEADASWLLLLVNESSATLEEKASGFISLRDPSGVDLSLLPLGNATRDLELGSVSSDTTGIASEFSLADKASGFSESFASLLETAYRDNVFKHAKNLYVNLDVDSGQWMMERTQCYATENIAKAMNEPMQVADWDFTPGFNMRIDSFYPAGHSYVSLNSGSDDIEIVPPEVITLKTNTPDPPFVFSPESPLLVSVAKDLPSGNAFWFSADTMHPEADGGYILEFDGEENLDDGFWRLNLIKDGTSSELAVFDMQSIDPFTKDADKAFIYYLPSIRVSVDALYRIERIDVSWYAWDPVSREYRVVTDFTAFEALIRGYNVSIVSDSFSGFEDVTDQLALIPVFPQYLENPQPGGVLVDWVRVGYTISGVVYSFTLYNEP